MKLVAVSKYVERQLILNGFEAEKTTNIYNISRFIEKRTSDAKFKTPTFAYGGRIESDKGIWDLVGAVEILKRESKNPFSIHIAGTGGEFENLKKYVMEHGLDHITLLGHITPDEVLSLYERSVAIIGPSRIPEPFGRFILDGISVGKPVIATRTGGMPEGIEEKVTGLLVDAGSAEQLAAAMKYFIEDPKRSDAMKDAIIGQRKYYAADVIGEQRLTLYESLLENLEK